MDVELYAAMAEEAAINAAIDKELQEDHIRFQEEDALDHSECTFHNCLHDDDLPF